jgi:hypothetical protein
MTMQKIFSVNLLNTNVIDNLLIFPKSIRTQESKFICGIYDWNTELDRDKSKQGDMT